MRTLFLLAVVVSLSGVAAAQTGTYYDTKTGEYLTLDEGSGTMVIRYSNGVRPFVTLLLVSDREPNVPDDGPYSGPSHFYSVAFATSPKTAYTLSLFQNERNGIDCTDANDQLLNQYSFISSSVFSAPDYPRILFEIGPSFTTDDESVSLTFGYSDIALVVTLTLPEGERELRVQSANAKENVVTFSDTNAHGPYVLKAFQASRFRMPAFDKDVLSLQVPGKGLVTLHN